MLDNVIKAKKNYYPHTFSEHKYDQNKTKMENLIDDDIGKSESDESDSVSNDETEYDDESDE